MPPVNATYFSFFSPPVGTGAFLYLHTLESVEKLSKIGIFTN
jgi:hypothetical protein